MIWHVPCTCSISSPTFTQYTHGYCWQLARYWKSDPTLAKRVGWLLTHSTFVPLAHNDNVNSFTTFVWSYLQNSVRPSERQSVTALRMLDCWVLIAIRQSTHTFTLTSLSIGSSLSSAKPVWESSAFAWYRFLWLNEKRPKKLKGFLITSPTPGYWKP